MVLIVSRKTDGVGDAVGDVVGDAVGNELFRKLERVLSPLDFIFLAVAPNPPPYLEVPLYKARSPLRY